MQKNPQSIYALVEQQVRRWQLEQQARGALRAEPAPVITVSRQFGALGAQLGRRVAERLGYTCWDRELLQEIARHASASELLFQSLDEHHRDIILETIGVFGATPKVTANEYHRELMRLVHTIAEHGKAVIIGRGAQYFLDPERTLRVRAVCPWGRRVKGVARRREVSESEAASLVEIVDRDRRDFIREHYARDIDDATEYDLIINTGTIAVDRAVDVVAAAYRSRFGERGQRQ